MPPLLHDDNGAVTVAVAGFVQSHSKQ